MYKTYSFGSQLIKRIKLSTCLIITTTVLILVSSCTTPKTVRYTKKLKETTKNQPPDKSTSDNNDELYITEEESAESKKIQEFEKLLVQAKSRKKPEQKNNTTSPEKVDTQYEEVKSGNAETIEQKKRRLPTLREQVVEMNKKTGSIEGRLNTMERDVNDIKRSVNDIKTAIIKYNTEKTVAEKAPISKPKKSIATLTAKKETTSQLLSKEERAVKTPIVQAVNTPAINNQDINRDDDFALGEQFYNSNDYSKATPYLTKVIRKQRSGNEAGQAHYYLGKINYEQKNYNQAISHLKRALTITGNGYKDNAQALLAESYIRSGNTELARQAYQSLIDNYPKSKYVPKARKMLQQL